MMIFLPSLEEAAEVTGAFGVAERGADLGELLDGVANLLVEDAAVGHNDNRIEHGGAAAFEPDELVGEPGDGVALAATGGVLDEVSLSRSLLLGGREQLPHNVELVVTRKYLDAFPLTGLVVSLLNHLGVALEDVGESRRREDPLPQVVGLDPVRVGRVAGAVVPAQVEGEEPGVFAGEVRAEPHLLVIKGEVGDTPPQLEEQLTRVAVALVLLHGIGDGSAWSGCSSTRT